MYERAIEEGEDRISVLFRSEILRFGEENVRRNISEAIRLLKARVEKGDMPPSALTTLSRWLRSVEAGDLRDPQCGVELLERAIEMKPYAPAIHDLAAIYKRGDFGMKPNVEKSQELFQLAHERGVYSDETL